jgi:GrpB-like predicted nucleotidyltransferase (UPF0157 family)
MSISVVAYDSDWPQRFELERAILERLLGPWLAGGIHHIGSTSVPGLAAKPIIDMMAGVVSLAEASPAIAVLTQQCSYEHAPHRPRAYWFYKPPSPHWYERTHHLHLTGPGSDLWRERLAFRDALRGDPMLRDEYQALKLRLAQASGDDVAAYTADKRDFVARVLARAGITLARGPVLAAPRPPAHDDGTAAALGRQRARPRLTGPCTCSPWSIRWTTPTGGR